MRKKGYLDFVRKGKFYSVLLFGELLVFVLQFERTFVNVPETTTVGKEEASLNISQSTRYLKYGNFKHKSWGMKNWSWFGDGD